MDAIISLNQTLLGKKIANVVCFSNFLEDETFLQSYADTIRASFQTYTEAHMTVDWALEDLTISFIVGGGIDYSVQVEFTNGALTGANSDQTLPPQSCLLISTSYVGSRPNRGRVYFSGLGEDRQTNGLWETTVLPPFTQMVTDWANGLTVEGSITYLRILRRPSVTSPSYVSNPVSLVSSTRGVRTQRRRARAS